MCQLRMDIRHIMRRSTGRAESPISLFHDRSTKDGTEGERWSWVLVTVLSSVRLSTASSVILPHPSPAPDLTSFPQSWCHCFASKLMIAKIKRKGRKFILCDHPVHARYCVKCRIYVDSLTPLKNSIKEALLTHFFRRRN